MTDYGRVVNFVRLDYYPSGLNSTTLNLFEDDRLDEAALMSSLFRNLVRVSNVKFHADLNGCNQGGSGGALQLRCVFDVIGNS